MKIELDPDEERQALKTAFLLASQHLMQALLALNPDPSESKAPQEIFAALDRQLAKQASDALAQQAEFPTYSIVLMDYVEMLRDLVAIAATSPPGATLAEASEELATLTALAKGPKR